MKEKPNDSIREYEKKHGVKLWQLAEAEHIADPTLSKRLRHELPPDEKARYYAQINKIASESRS